MEVLAVDLESTTYKRAAGALEVFTAGSWSSIYKRAAGSLEAFTVDPESTTYKRFSPPSAVAFSYKSSTASSAASMSGTSNHSRSV
ncbi:hypothetical protein CK500_13525 [Halorubrum salipaludis]|uniref:Uncharacterized protein n=1 Tax=Halorubrum salipaludis TaxID=2032630 RepID=A0A2A2FDI4_9EURY|nr:hypothetical protein CK500_13525 [Halorubrum salipaludis]